MGSPRRAHRRGHAGPSDSRCCPHRPGRDRRRRDRRRRRQGFDRGPGRSCTVRGRPPDGGIGAGWHRRLVRVAVQRIGVGGDARYLHLRRGLRPAPSRGGRSGGRGDLPRCRPTRRPRGHGVPRAPSDRRQPHATGRRAGHRARGDAAACRGRLPGHDENRGRPTQHLARHLRREQRRDHRGDRPAHRGAGRSATPGRRPAQRRAARGARTSPPSPAQPPLPHRAARVGHRGPGTGLGPVGRTGPDHHAGGRARRVDRRPGDRALGRRPTGGRHPAGRA